MIILYFNFVSLFLLHSLKLSNFQSGIFAPPVCARQDHVWSDLAWLVPRLPGSTLKFLFEWDNIEIEIFEDLSQPSVWWWVR